MTVSDLNALLPLIIIAAAAIILMAAIAVRRNHQLSFLIAALGAVSALISLPAVSSSAPHQATGLFIVDSYSLLFTGLILAGSFITLIFSYERIESQAGFKEEYYLLLLLATLGSIALVSAAHFISFFLGLEILSVSLYALISYERSDAAAIGAGIKYLVLASVSAGFLLFGLALIYFETGTMEFARTSFPAAMGSVNIMLFAGYALVFVGIGFKLGIVPFHMWTPDVYDGAPTPISAFIASVSKGAVLGLLLRYAGKAGIPAGTSLFTVISLVAAGSMIAGNLLALFEDRVRRILAYSSISHMGYMLTAFLAGGALASAAVAFYLAAYFVTIFAAFGTLVMMNQGNARADRISDFRSLAWKQPWQAGVFIASLFSLAGIPMTAGFTAKFYVIYAGAKSGLWTLLIIVAASSVIGLFYYLRVIIAMFEHYDADEATDTPRIPVKNASAVTMAVLLLFLVLLGVWPGPVIQMIADLAVIR